MWRAILGAMLLGITAGGIVSAEGDTKPAVKKISDFVIYRDDLFYSAFPSVVVRPDGEILCAFRRAPNRRIWGGQESHCDPNSYLVLVRSKDGGKSWSNDPELIYAHPFGGSQDPCMVQLRDACIVCTSYAWALLPSEGVEKLKGTLSHTPYAFLGGYIMRSDDGAKTWKGPFVPMTIPGNASSDALGDPLPTYNRGAMMQRADGKLYWAAARQDNPTGRHTSVHLLISSDRGETWQYSCPVAQDEAIAFNETSLIETPKGDIVAFLRVAVKGRESTCFYARSTNGGKSFGEWQDAGFVGHPFHAVRVKGNRVLLVYGYRNPLYGIRARLLNPECTDIATATESVIRDDGGSGDLGYPWAAVLPDGRVLVAYYFNIEGGTKFIAGSLLSVE